MPSLDQNSNVWGSEYHWVKQGDEWSEAWSGPDMQWYVSFLPRLHSFLPAKTILEIAPGFGRWTQFLKEWCDTLIAVDLNENCIEYCRSRFISSPQVQLHVNDGKSLAMATAHSVDLVVSFDSLVHAEADVIDAYLGEFARILTKDGVAVIHHSNFGNCVPPPAIRNLLQQSKIRRILSKIEPFRAYCNFHWRAESMTAQNFEKACEKHNLRCISQEMINWGGPALNDCISVVTTSGSAFARPNAVIENRRFMDEAERAKQMSRVYGWVRYGPKTPEPIAASRMVAS